MDNVPEISVLNACRNAQLICYDLVQQLQALRSEDGSPWLLGKSQDASDPLMQQALKLVERAEGYKAAKEGMFAMLSSSDAHAHGQTEMQQLHENQNIQLTIDTDLQASAILLLNLGRRQGGSAELAQVTWMCHLCPANSTDSRLRTRCATGILLCVNDELRLKDEGSLCKPCGDWLSLQLRIRFKRWDRDLVSKEDQLAQIKALIAERWSDPRRSKFVLQQRAKRYPV